MPFIPLSGSEVPLFDPRQQHWYDHFAWSLDGIEMIGLTPIGRATIATLKTNDALIRAARVLWIGIGAHPPRGHDHRARWEEMLDTCTGSGGTLDSGPAVRHTEWGLPARYSPFDPDAVAKVVGVTRGRRQFEDSLGMCIFTTRTWVSTLCRALSAATGWDYTKEEAMRFGRRTAALLRVFNLRCGITPELERPSKRYGSIPVDGPARGQNVLEHWERMLDGWYAAVGYDRQTGKPLPETLQELGLDYLIPELWGEKETSRV